MELLDNEGLSKDSKALEVGPGDGELLVELLREVLMLLPLIILKRC